MSFALGFVVGFAACFLLIRWSKQKMERGY